MLPLLPPDTRAMRYAFRATIALFFDGARRAYDMLLLLRAGAC